MLDFFETWRGRRLFQTGHLSDAAAALEGRFDAADGTPVAGALYAAGLVALGRIAIHTGDERQKRRTAALAGAMVADGTPPTATRRLAPRTPGNGRRPTCGCPRGARCRQNQFSRRVTPLYPMDVTDDPQLVRIALAAGDSRLAADTVDAAEEQERRNPEISDRAAAARARGLLDADAASLAAACLLFDDVPRPLALASALEDLGVAQLRTGAQAAGVDALGRALVLYTEAGATWDAGRARGRLRQAASAAGS